MEEKNELFNWHELTSIDKVTASQLKAIMGASTYMYDDQLTQRGLNPDVIRTLSAERFIIKQFDDLKEMMPFFPHSKEYLMNMCGANVNFMDIRSGNSPHDFDMTNYYYIIMFNVNKDYLFTKKVIIITDNGGYHDEYFIEEENIQTEVVSSLEAFYIMGLIGFMSVIDIEGLNLTVQGLIMSI
jgi:hypothetical protein